jgi:hypothetical protein
MPSQVNEDIRIDDSYKQDGADLPYGATNHAAPKDESVAKVLENGNLNNVRLAEALASDPLKGWSKSSIQLYLCLAVAYMASVQNGFDGSIMSNINASKSFSTQKVKLI